MVSWLNYDPELLKTTNGGEIWVQVFMGGEWIYDVNFINPNTGWIVGAVQLGYLFKATTDGGTTWIDKNVSPNFYGELKDIDVIDNMNLIIASNDILFKTTDGGSNWEEITVSYLWRYDLQFLNMTLGWARGDNVNGGILFKTTDSGYSWYQQAQPITSYQFITEQVGWYISNNEIYYSIDGGNFWTLQNSNTNYSLYDMFFLDNNNGWAVGANGTILNTINGGIPVELISFTAEILENEVELNWSTATETNNSGFEILRFAQNDKDEWIKIGFVPGHGTTTETQHYSFTDNDVKPGKYQYKLKQIDYDGTFEYSQIVEVEIPIVNKFSLSQNYPNPFNPTTSLQYAIGSLPDGKAGRQFVTLKVYDLLGREIATLINEEKPAGEYEVEFNAANLPSGIYFYKLNAGQFSETKKMVLIR